jgi:hypothetical protein
MTTTTTTTTTTTKTTKTIPMMMERLKKVHLLLEEIVAALGGKIYRASVPCSSVVVGGIPATRHRIAAAAAAVAAEGPDQALPVLALADQTDCPFRVDF